MRQCHTPRHQHTAAMEPHMPLLCQLCGQPADVTPTLCRCGAVAFCSQRHLLLACRNMLHTAQACQRMRQQLTRAQQVLHHDLQWPTLQGEHDVHAWLQRLGCHTRGLLQHACRLPGCSPAASQGADGDASASTARGAAQLPQLPGSEQAWRAAWALPDSLAAPAWRLDQPADASQQAANAHAVTDWRTYYAARGMDPTSPAALALHFPLTLWHCLAQLLPGRGWPLPAAGSTLRVAYLGAQVELQLLPAFVELAMLLPQHHLELHMIGPDVSDALHGRAASVRPQPRQGGLTVVCWSGCWHDMVADWAHLRSVAAQDGGELAAPHAARGAAAQHSGSWQPAGAPCGAFHCVFAPNAGLPVYRSWLECSLPQLARMAAPAAAPDAAGHQQRAVPQDSAVPVPVVFTDYCEEAAHTSGELAEQLLRQRFTLQPALNPFRCAAPSTTHGTLLPSCSNAFLFGWA